MMVVASMWDWTRRYPWRAAAWLLLVVLALASLGVCAAQPRLDRNWVDNLAVMPKVETTDAGFALDGVVDWSYTKDGPATRTVGDFAASYADLRNVWFMVEPQPGGDYAAHTLVLFEFAGDRVVGLTVEARLEKGETYDAHRRRVQQVRACLCVGVGARPAHAARHLSRQGRLHLSA